MLAPYMKGPYEGLQQILESGKTTKKKYPPNFIIFHTTSRHTTERPKTPHPTTPPTPPPHTNQHHTQHPPTRETAPTTTPPPHHHLTPKPPPYSHADTQAATDMLLTTWDANYSATFYNYPYSTHENH